MVKLKIYYAYDALCGWCYGFSPVIQRFAKENADKFTFEVLSGGMVRGARVGPIAQVAPDIKEAYKQVEQTSGVKFGESFLKSLNSAESPVFDSIPAAKAMAILKRMQPERQIEFASALQKAIYFDGMPPQDVEGMANVIGKFGIERKYFIDAMQTDESAHKASEEFQLIENWGINGFPAVILDRGDQLFLAARGYTDYDRFSQTVQGILAETPKS